MRPSAIMPRPMTAVRAHSVVTRVERGRMDMDDSGFSTGRLTGHFGVRDPLSTLCSPTACGRRPGWATHPGARPLLRAVDGEFADRHLVAGLTAAVRTVGDDPYVASGDGHVQ